MHSKGMRAAKAQGVQHVEIDFEHGKTGGGLSAYRHAHLVPREGGGWHALDDGQGGGSHSFSVQDDSWHALDGGQGVGCHRFGGMLGGGPQLDTREGGDPRPGHRRGDEYFVYEHAHPGHSEGRPAFVLEGQN